MGVERRGRRAIDGVGLTWRRDSVPDDRDRQERQSPYDHDDASHHRARRQERAPQEHLVVHRYIVHGVSDPWLI
jgi:hypothetical protein